MAVPVAVTLPQVKPGAGMTPISSGRTASCATLVRHWRAGLPWYRWH